MIAARIQSRKMLFRSWKGLQYDDWIMGIFITATYTVLVVMANRWLKYSSNLERPGFDFSALSDNEIVRRRLGSIFMIVTEQMQITVIWSCKATLLIMYHRLTRTALRNENIAIRILSAYTVLGFVVIEVLYFAAWCRPFSAYYAVPTTSTQCNTLINHRITKAVFNISSDIIMLCIALQMLIRSLLPLKRKVILLGIFSLGIFVVAASVVNSYSSFKNPYGHTWMYWYIREASTAVLVANLPFTWTILRDIFELGDFNENNPPPPWTYHSPRTAPGRKTAQYLQRTSITGPRSTAHQSPLNSNALTLVGSGSPTKQITGFPIDTPHAEDEKDYIGDDGTVQRHDFAPVAIKSEPEGSLDVDLEPGYFQTCGRPISPDHTSERKDLMTRPSKITEDGTGGFYMNNRPISPPPRAHLVPSLHTSREPSLSSTNRRPMSPTPNHLSALEDSQERRGSVASVAGAMGGGRSATDRKTRAKMSH